MTGETTPERLARTESLFREVNERIAESAERFDADEAEFVCECADAECTHRVEASLDDYERVREEPTAFLVVDGHQDPRVEASAERDPDGDSAVARKLHPDAARVARASDPRDDDA
jgi:hypothetical protein